MPKRSNTFQRLIYHIQRQLAGQSLVTESKLLRDRVTGQEREVDVVIESKIGDYELSLSVECNAGGRKGSVEWVERMVEKHRDLPTNQLVLVSQAGFSKSAKRKAEFAGVVTYTFGHAIQADWTEIVGSAAGVLTFANLNFLAGSSQVFSGELGRGALPRASSHPQAIAVHLTYLVTRASTLRAPESIDADQYRRLTELGLRSRSKFWSNDRKSQVFRWALWGRVC